MDHPRESLPDEAGDRVLVSRRLGDLQHHLFQLGIVLGSDVSVSKLKSNLGRLRGHPYMTLALRGGGGLAQKKV